MVLYYLASLFLLSRLYSFFSVFVSVSFFFFFTDTATTEIYTLSLHDALPISPRFPSGSAWARESTGPTPRLGRSEEHTSELQSLRHLVCRLLLEKKKKKYTHQTQNIKSQHDRPCESVPHILRRRCATTR